jgi:hypothetical protein
MLCASCSCFVLCAQNHIFWSQIACFMLMLCALCLAVRNKKTRMLSAWQAVTKKPDKQKERSTEHKA